MKKDITCTLDKELVYSPAVYEFQNDKGIIPRDKQGDMVIPNNVFGDQMMKLTYEYYKKINEPLTGIKNSKEI